MTWGKKANNYATLLIRDGESNKIMTVKVNKLKLHSLKPREIYFLIVKGLARAGYGANRYAILNTSDRLNVLFDGYIPQSDLILASKL